MECGVERNTPTPERLLKAQFTDFRATFLSDSSVMLLDESTQKEEYGMIYQIHNLVSFSLSPFSQSRGGQRGCIELPVASSSHLN